MKVPGLSTSCICIYECNVRQYTMSYKVATNIIITYVVVMDDLVTKTY